MNSLNKNTPTCALTDIIKHPFTSLSSLCLSTLKASTSPRVLPDGWNIWGINVGENATMPQAPRLNKALPAEITGLDTTDIFAEPVMESAPTELRFHVLDYRPGYGQTQSFSQQHRRIRGIHRELDEKGNGTISPDLSCTSNMLAQSSKR